MPSKKPERGWVLHFATNKLNAPGALQNAKHAPPFFFMKLIENSTLGKRRARPHFLHFYVGPWQNEKHAKLLLQERPQNLAIMTLQKSTMANFSFLQGGKCCSFKDIQNKLPKLLHFARKTKLLLCKMRNISFFLSTFQNAKPSAK